MNISDNELPTILAALRVFQSNYGLDYIDWQYLFDCYFDKFPPLTDQEIDELCEKLNYATDS